MCPSPRRPSFWTLFDPNYSISSHKWKPIGEGGDRWRTRVVVVVVVAVAVAVVGSSSSVIMNGVVAAGVQ